MPHEQTDRELMTRVQADDEAAFTALYGRLAGRAHAVARSVCFDAVHAEEAVQEGFVSMWRARLTYAPERGDVHVWAFGIVRNRAIDSVRRQGRHSKRRDPEYEAERPGDVDVAATVIAMDDAARLRAHVAQLPPAQREVIALSFYGELSHAQIAFFLDVPLGTVKGRMRLGLEKLRPLLTG